MPARPRPAPHTHQQRFLLCFVWLGRPNSQRRPTIVPESPSTSTAQGAPPCRVYVGILSRAAADPDFFYKVSVECGIDAIIIASVNWGARGESFFDELEFVFCQVRHRPEFARGPATWSPSALAACRRREAGLA